MHPTHPQLILLTIQPAFERAGLMLTRFEPVSMQGAIWEFSVQLRNNESEWHAWVYTMPVDVDGRGFTPNISAIGRLLVDERIPVSPSMTTLNHPAVPFPVAITPEPCGIPYAQLEPAQQQQALHLTGRMLAALAETVVPRFGRLPVQSGFLPQRRSWREAWALHAQRELEDCVRVGGLSPALASRVTEALRSRLPSLDEVQIFSQVHGNLSPFLMLYTNDDSGNLDVAMVRGWERSFWGDPLAEWSLLAAIPDAQLKHIVDGFGVERFQAWSDEASAARLEVYQLTHALTTLRESALPHLPEAQRGIYRSIALSRLDAALEDGAGLRELSRATGAKTFRRPSRMNETEALAFRYLDRLVYHPVLTPQETERWVIGAANVELALSLEDGKLREGYTEIALALFAGLEPPSDRLINDQVNLPDALQSIAVDMVSLDGNFGRCAALQLLAGATELSRTLGEWAPPGLASGVVPAAVAAWAQEAANAAGTTATTRLLAGLVGLAALEGIEENATHAPLQERLRSQISEAWEVTGEMVENTAPEVGREGWVAGYATMESQQNLHVPVASVLTAFPRVQEQVGFNLDTLMAALGIQQPE